jgi:hypothetical protein
MLVVMEVTSGETHGGILNVIQLYSNRGQIDAWLHVGYHGSDKWWDPWWYFKCNPTVLKITDGGGLGK